MPYTKKDLFDAIAGGNAPKVSQIIATQPDIIHHKNDEGYTPVATAIYHLSKDSKISPRHFINDLSPRQCIIINLVNHGADIINITDPQQFCALQVAISRGSRFFDDNYFSEAKLYLKIVEQLLLKVSQDNNLSARLNELLKPRDGKIEGVKQTPLHMAIYFGYPEMVSLCLQHQADISLATQDGLNALHLSVLVGLYSSPNDKKRQERLAITKTLLETLQARKNYLLINQPWSGKWYLEVDKLTSTCVVGSDDTALHHAVTANALDYVQLLCQFNANTNLQNAQRETPYDIAHKNWQADKEKYEFTFRCVSAIQHNRNLNFDDDITSLLTEMAKSKTGHHSTSAHSAANNNDDDNDSDYDNHSPSRKKSIVITNTLQQSEVKEYQNAQTQFDAYVKSLEVKQQKASSISNNSAEQQLIDSLNKASVATETNLIPYCIPIVGTISSGKSSLANYLCGLEMETYTIKKSQRVRVKNPKLELFKIEHTHNFTTLTPQIAAATNNDNRLLSVSFCDCPTLDKKHDASSDSALSINTLLALNAAAHVPAMIITLSKNELEENASGLVSLFNYLNSFINNIDELKQALIFVITKVENPDDIDDTDIKRLAQRLSQKIKEEINTLSARPPAQNTNLINKEKIYVEKVAQLKILDLLQDSQNIVISNLLLPESREQLFQLLSEMQPIDKKDFCLTVDESFKTSFSNHLISTIVTPGHQLFEARKNLKITSNKLAQKISEHDTKIEEIKNEIDILKSPQVTTKDPIIVRLERQIEGNKQKIEKVEKKRSKLQNQLLQEQEKIKELERDVYEYLPLSTSSSRSSLNLLGLACETKLSYHDDWTPYESVELTKCINGSTKNETSSADRTSYQVSFCPDPGTIGQCEIKLKINRKSKYETKLQVQQCHNQCNLIRSIIDETNEEMLTLTKEIAEGKTRLHQRTQNKESDIETANLEEQKKLELIRQQEIKNRDSLKKSLSELQRKLAIVDAEIQLQMVNFDLVVKIIPLLKISSPLVEQFLQEYKQFSNEYVIFTFSETEYHPNIKTINTIHLAGTFNDERIDDKWLLKRSASGLWTLSVELELVCDINHYYFIINRDLNQKYTSGGERLDNSGEITDNDLIDDLEEQGNTTTPPLNLVPAIRQTKTKIKDIKKLMNAATVNQIDIEQGHVSPLHAAVGCGRQDVVILLLKMGALCDQLDGTGCTALSLACKTDPTQVKTINQIIKTLLKHKANLTLADVNGNTPLHYLAQIGNTMMLESILVQGGRNCLLQNLRLQSPLHIAARYGQLLFLKKLVAYCKKAPARESKLQQSIKLDLINAMDNQGDNVLHTAVRYQQIEIVNYLLVENIFDISSTTQNGDTSLHLAAMVKNISLINLLLQYNVRLDTQNKAGKTIFDLVQNDDNNDSEIATILFRYKKGKFLELLIPMRFYKDDKALTIKLKNSLIDDTDEIINNFISSQQWDNLLLITHSIRNQLKKSFESATKNKREEEKLHSLTQLVKQTIINASRARAQQTTGALFLSSPDTNFLANTSPKKAEITHSEDEFEKTLKDHLEKFYYIAVGILEGLAERAKSGGDKVVSGMKMAGAVLPAAGAVAGQLIPTDNFVVTSVASKLGMQGKEGQLMSAAGTAVGLAAQLAVCVIGKIIETKLTKDALARSTHIKEAFEEAGQARLDHQKIDMIVFQMRLRFRDQINQLTDDSIKRFAACIGQRILTHIIKNKDHYLDQSEGLLQFFKRAPNIREQRDILERCFNALKSQTDIGTGHDYYLSLLKTPSQHSEQWCAAGIIDQCGYKVQLLSGMGVHYYIKESDDKNKTYGRYGFCTISEIFVDKIKRAGYTHSLLAMDIFAENSDADNGKKQTASTSTATNSLQ